MYYIGLMSGTSADGIDLALVSFTDNAAPENSDIQLVASYFQPYQADLAQRIKSLYNSAEDEIDLSGSLDIELAHVFSHAVTAFLKQQELTPQDIIAIGNHGQTIRHRPTAKFPFTLQIGCSQTLACLTGIKVIGQFRQKDIALGGQGAPLVPAFHQKIFNNTEQDVFFVNIGGIANISYLPVKEGTQVQGFDTGPGNALLDDWFVHCHTDATIQYDESGQWASSGELHKPLLAQLLSDPYFALPAPKSTGREHFTFDWLKQHLASIEETSLKPIQSRDIQATLATFTAITIAQEIKQLSQCAQVITCGGGVHNNYLMKLLADCLNEANDKHNYSLVSASSLAIDSDALEAMAFAWLAYANINGLPSNMPSVTGASRACSLGLSYLP
ncbi:anhydro-N-acetylmuramic acid kinase [Litorilituus lipolyticus]|uniref:Anhydro-N-acetylmuramic acid kinase n=1 Tax=Litorilituus lipolyticus TaxID=2491017 RepID=A0A502L4U9_9GAMM|nr:anhydro-N-acetylmuramic acid kinase [Litorilituus lipolyticus]TPH17331.1 anhydro-N-acetylmuramic acid kinase [Litorilituus lipolyticus]